MSATQKPEMVIMIGKKKIAIIIAVAVIITVVASTGVLMSNTINSNTAAQKEEVMPNDSSCRTNLIDSCATTAAAQEHMGKVLENTRYSP